MAEILTGKENDRGEFKMRAIGESHEGESAKEAITRVAERFLSKPLGKNHRWHLTYCGPNKPALFIENQRSLRIFKLDYGQ